MTSTSGLPRPSQTCPVVRNVATRTIVVEFMSVQLPIAPQRVYVVVLLDCLLLRGFVVDQTQYMTSNLVTHIM